MRDRPETIPSLPYLIARTVQSKPLECDDENRATLPVDPSPRIQYTLPGLDAHADSDSRMGNEFRMRVLYARLYIRCVAAKLWDPRSECSQPDTYKNAVVVIGASNPLRRDRHFTPLGDMSGAEVTINAARSFLLNPAKPEKSLSDKAATKCLITFLCSLVWLAYFVAKHRMSACAAGKRPSVGARFKMLGAQTIAFMVALAAAVALALSLSFWLSGPSANVDVLIPVLAIGLELYAEMSMAIVGAAKWLWPFRR